MGRWGRICLKYLGHFWVRIQNYPKKVIHLIQIIDEFENMHKFMVWWEYEEPFRVQYWAYV